jgi:Tol biopolymer transport system component
MNRIVFPAIIVAVTCAYPAQAQEIAIRPLADVSGVGAQVARVTLSPDGRYLAVMPQRRGDIWLLDRRTGSLRPLQLGTTWGTVWEPGSRELAFTRVDEEDRSGVYTIGVAEGATVRRVAVDPIDSYSPVYSPRGDSIAFVGTLGCEDDWVACWRLVAVPARGGERRIIVEDVGWAIDWSRDGQWIYYGLGNSGAVTFYRVSTAGDRREQIASTGDRGTGPDIGLSPDNRYFGISLAPPEEGGRHTVVIHTSDGRELIRRDLPPGILPQGWTSGNDLIGLHRGDRTVVEIEISSLLP